MSDNSQNRIPHLSRPYTPEVETAVSRMMPKDRDIEPLKLFRTFVRDLPFTKAMGPLGGFMLAGRDKGARLSICDLVKLSLTASARVVYANMNGGCTSPAIRTKPSLPMPRFIRPYMEMAAIPAGHPKTASQ